MAKRCVTDPIDLRVLALASVAQRCARETELFFQRRRYNPRYCFELFRRAIVERSQGAWELAYAQYRPLVAGWVERHPAFPASGEHLGGRCYGAVGVCCYLNPSLSIFINHFDKFGYFNAIFKRSGWVE